MEECVLSNGFRIVYENVPSSQNTAFRIYCDFGSAHETDVRGVAHFIEHMCFKGTKRLQKPTKIFEKYDKIGAFLNAFTEKSHTSYVVRCANEYVENCLKIMSDMVLNSTFPTSSFRKEEQVVIEENVKLDDDQQLQIYDEIERMLYQGTAYEWPIDATSYHKTLFDPKYIREMYARVYVPNRMLLSIATSLPFSRIRKFVSQSYFCREPTVPLRPLPSLTRNLWSRGVAGGTAVPLPRLMEKPGLSAAHLAIAFRMEQVEDRHILALLCHILSGSMSARLFSVLREENGLTYTSSAEITTFSHFGDLLIYAETDAAKLLANGTKPGVIPLIIKLLHNLVRKGISEKELATAKSYGRGSMSIFADSNAHRAEYNGNLAILFPNERRISCTRMYDEVYDKITLREMNECISRTFQYETMSVCIIGSKLPSASHVEEICRRI
jgi:predicted Zn-dependent peptidase